MKYAKTLTLLFLAALLSGVTLYVGCGDYVSPETASEAEKTGFYVVTRDQKTYTADTLFDQCDSEVDPTTGAVTYKYETWGESKNIDADFVFIVAPNPALGVLDTPYFAIIDECRLDIEYPNGTIVEGDWHDCGPWRAYLELATESEITISVNVWSLGALQNYLFSGGSMGDSMLIVYWYYIRAKSVDGTEQEAKNYANVHLNPVSDACDDWSQPSWYQLLLPECANFIDDDGDGFFDAADPGCGDGTELPFDVLPACSDGIDNDGDGDTDFPADDGCADAASNIEDPECDDGIDNEPDGNTDWPADLECTSASDNDESA